MSSPIKSSSLRKREISRAFGNFVANLELSCCRGLQRLGGILAQFITTDPGCQPIKRRSEEAKTLRGVTSVLALFPERTLSCSVGIPPWHAICLPLSRHSTYR